MKINYMFVEYMKTFRIIYFELFFYILYPNLFPNTF